MIATGVGASPPLCWKRTQSLRGSCTPLYRAVPNMSTFQEVVFIFMGSGNRCLYLEPDRCYPALQTDPVRNAYPNNILRTSG
jgi:hypothetical protein